MNDLSSTSFSDFSTILILHHFYEIGTESDLYRITRGFHRVFVKVIVCKQEKFSLTDTWCVPLLGFAHAQIYETIFPKSVVILSIFHFKYPLIVSRF